MKIELHASNDITIETRLPSIEYDLNESAGKLDVQRTDGEDVEVSYLDIATMQRVIVYTGHCITIGFKAQGLK